MEYVETTIPNLAPDEKGYRVNQVHFAAVRIGRAAGAAKGMFGVTACAFAVNEDGTARLSHALTHIEGAHTSALPQADLLTDGRLDQGKVDEIKGQALEGAFTAMLAAIASEEAFEQLEV